MISRKSHTRITLALDIIRKLDSGPFKGYHELAIIKHQIALNDILHVKPSPKLNIRCDHPYVPCDERNICWKAVELVKNRFGIDENVDIQIEKHIPVMGGMAGGSANAATMLQILDELWSLNLSTEQLSELGRDLGMDVPFFFRGGTAFDSESTGVLEPIPTNLKLHFVLAIPEFGVSTKDAYSSLDYSVTGKRTVSTSDLKAGLKSDNLELVAQNMHNDFEDSVFVRFSRLREIRNSLLKAGCLSAVMSGSGSTLLGVVGSEAEAEKVACSIDCQTIVTQTLNGGSQHSGV
ncbi:MAG: 4-(cytidine 5'-diphospho)-2-C-methyl-D-erythritol kinase [Chitinispirillaceae bacterium]